MSPLTAALCTITLVACLDSTQGRIDDTRDERDATGDSHAPDAATRDASTALDTADTGDVTMTIYDTAGPDVCADRLQVASIDLVRFERFDDGGHLTIDRGTLYGTRRVGTSAGVPGDTEVVAVDLATLDERLVTDNDVDDGIVDARGGVLLVVRRDGAAQTLARIGPQAWTYTVPEGFVFVPGLFDDGAPRRLVDGPRVAWAEAWTGRVGTKSRIRLREGGDTRTVAEVSGWLRSPFVRGRVVLWAEQAEGVEQVLRRAQGEEIVDVARGTIGAYGVIDSGPVWIEPGGIFTRRDGERAALREGPCGALALGEDVLAAVCGSEQPELGLGLARGDIVVQRPGEGAWTIGVPDDVVVAGLRVDGARAAWIEYAPDVGCGDTIGQDRGRVFVASYRSGERVSVSDVGAGCWCCGAYWPPVATALEGEHVAWSYALEANAEPWGVPATIGVARLTSSCAP
ncbi:MAG: hypothetical protein IT385_20825 [Deltaproteobacteria bacterium]|nr:hypothetical protein [Deltaproteobacteria bacterium]